MTHRPDRDIGVELAHYRQHGAAVRLTCRDCMHHRDLPLEAVIAQLRARGYGGEHTGIRAVARFVNQPCPRCGKTRFETTPAFPSGDRRSETQEAPRPEPGGEA